MSTETRLRGLEIGLESLRDMVNGLQEELQSLREPEPVEPVEGLLPEEERRNIFLQSVPIWAAEETYVEGALV